MLNSESVQSSKMNQMKSKKEMIIKKKCMMIWPGVLYQKDSRIEIEGNFTCSKGNCSENLVTCRIGSFRNQPAD
jgi:hypothetical protein